MAVLKCKMCGGDLVFEPDSTVCECEYCGTKQTIPVADDEKKMKLYERANKLRYNCDFDKAAGVYESIVNDYSNEAEAYWGLVLCTYGIEYVDDPNTGKKIPTCHRSSFDSVMEDENFELVMENSDAVSRFIYREEAKAIEELRKGIIEVSGKEEPYDIFICYKETDEEGQRTIDSVIAQDIYDKLTEKGYRVFFSRISLEDKLGTEYEPYIFAALNSAKVMLAFGTSYDYYNAVWVKNEWGRYLKLMTKDKRKHLIPCYKNIDAYDIPKEFARLQAQDMGKVGADQDLIRGIEKLLGAGSTQQNTPQPQMIIQQTGPNAEALVKRGNIELEDSDWDQAREYFNQALNIDAENGYAFLGILMAKKQCCNIQEMKEKFVEEDLSEEKEYIRAKRHADHVLQDELLQWEYALVDKYRKEQQSREEEAERRINEKEKRREKKEALIKKLEELKNLKLSDEKEKLLTGPGAELKKAADEAKARYDSVLEKYINLPQQEELNRLKTEIKTKTEYMSGLGILRGKEKKQIQLQIQEMEKKCRKLSTFPKDKLKELELLKKVQEKALAEYNDWKNKNELGSNDGIDSLESQISLLTALDDDKENYCFFGHYKQTERKPVKWKVLVREKTRMLLFSEYGIDSKSFSLKSDNETWETCTLRKWLNETFYNEVFTEAEQDLIVNTEVSADNNPEFDTVPGNPTIDKVFLLSIGEAEKYFPDSRQRICKPTEYAVNQYVNVDKENGNCWWWLRSPGLYSNFAANVSSDGSINYRGYRVSVDDVAVRPALWVDLK